MYLTLAAPKRLQRLVYLSIPRHARKNLGHQGKNHARSCLMRSIRREVEWPGSGGMWITAIPGARAGFFIFTALFAELALLPSTKISGANSFKNLVANRTSASSTATSTDSNAATISARSAA